MTTTSQTAEKAVPDTPPGADPAGADPADADPAAGAAEEAILEAATAGDGTPGDPTPDDPTQRLAVLILHHPTPADSAAGAATRIAVTDERPDEGQPQGDQPSGEQPDGEQPDGDQPVDLVAVEPGDDGPTTVETPIEQLSDDLPDTDEPASQPAEEPAEEPQSDATVEPPSDETVEPQSISSPELISSPEPISEPAPTNSAQLAPQPLAPGAIRRAPALDGLRGIAVLAVVVYHLFGNVLRGGYLGVDIFFVLSGFLITSLLVREFGATGRISLAEFWKRRVRRIVPAAVTVLLVCTAVAGMIGGDTAVKLPQQFFTSLVFVNNWGQIAESQSYFANTSPRIFMHYWSLAIEEQFYVVWPLLFILTMWLSRGMRVRRRMLFSAAITTALTLASMAAMVWLHDADADPSRVYFGSDTHAFGLLAGVTLALIVTSPNRASLDSWPQSVSDRATRVIGWTLGPLAFAGLIVLLFVLPDTAPITYRGGLFLACLLTAVVVHNAIRENGPVPVLLRSKALRWLGERSFSLYLWHWPVMVFTAELLGDPQTGTSPWLIGTVAAVVSIILSVLSYRWIETPFRRLGVRGVLRRIADTSRRGAPAAAVIAAIIVAMLAGSALGTSPAKSAQQLELERQTALLKQAQAAPPPPPRTVPELPPGTEITGVGDSVMLASAQSLLAKFPGMLIDAEVSRHYTGGEEVLQALRANGDLRDYVVLGFGTNGQAFPGQLDRILRLLGPRRKVVLVVPYGPVDGIPQAARQVLDYAPRHANVFLAPWCSSAAANPDLLGADGVHPFDQGTELYVEAVAAGLKQAVTGKRDIQISCPL